MTSVKDMLHPIKVWHPFAIFGPRRNLSWTAVLWLSPSLRMSSFPLRYLLKAFITYATSHALAMYSSGFFFAFAHASYWLPPLPLHVRILHDFPCGQLHFLLGWACPPRLLNNCVLLFINSCTNRALMFSYTSLRKHQIAPHLCFRSPLRPTTSRTAVFATSATIRIISDSAWLPQHSCTPPTFWLFAAQASDNPRWFLVHHYTTVSTFQIAS